MSRMACNCSLVTEGALLEGAFGAPFEAAADVSVLIAAPLVSVEGIGESLLLVVPVAMMGDHRMQVYSLWLAEVGKYFDLRRIP